MTNSTDDTLVVPSTLLARINAAAAEERRPAGALIQEALERYMEEREWKKLFAYGEARAKALGLTEDDVPRLIAEARRERHQEQAGA